MWIPTIFLNLEQGLQQSVDLFSGKITADHLFRLQKEFAEAAADFLPRAVRDTMEFFRLSSVLSRRIRPESSIFPRIGDSVAGSIRQPSAISR
ncbi:MAG: hypothetical protein L6W00_11010 [Lentisphaeria bacterium]|nr:MAG: hypothetical protein L6W00_11010 [Lentisphaeria bacterium]